MDKSHSEESKTGNQAQKRTDETFRETEGFFGNVMEYSPIGIHIIEVDSEGKLVFRGANEAADKILGIDHRQYIGKTLEEVMLAAGHSGISEMYYRVALDGEPWQTENIGYDENDKIKLAVDIHAFQASPGRVVAMFRDITERKRAEIALKDSEEKYRLLADFNPDGIVVHALGKIVYANERAMKLLGAVSREDILDKDPFDFIHPNYHQLVKERIKNSRERGEPTDPAEEVFLRVDGKHVALEVTSIPFSYEGKPGTQVVIRDLSVRKRSEKALLNSEARFRSIVESSPMGIHMYRLQPDGKLVFMVANPAADDILGVDNTQFIGKTIEDAFPPLADTEVPEKYRLAAIKGVPWHTEQIVYQDERISGVYEVYAFQTSPGRMAAMFLDVTERKKAEEALRRERRAFRIIAESALHFQSIPDLCRHVLEGLLETLGFGFGTIRLFDKELRTLEPTAVIGLEPETVNDKVTTQSIDDSELIAAHVARTQLPIFAPDVSKHEISSTHKARLEELNIRSLISCPILGNKDELIGVMQLVSETPKELTLEDENFFSTVAGMFATVLVRSRTERALRENEIRYRTLFENAGDAIFLMKEDLFADCNAKTLELFACTRDDIIGKPPYLFSPSRQPDGQDSKDAALDRINAALSGEPQHFCWKHIRLDGTPFDAEVSLNRLELGDEVMLQAIVRDITERKKVEEALRESEEKFRGLAESVKDVIFSLSLDGTVLYINPAVKDIMGIEPEKVIGRKFLEMGFISPQIKEAYRTKLGYVLKHDSVPLFEIELKTTTGSKRFFEFSARKLSNIIVGVARDVTDRKRTEQEIKNALIEKELLLKEIHHRVKNNLQVISSLLSLQAGYIKDEATLQIFSESRNRVKSMALIHEKLYQSKDMAKIDFGEYVADLASSLFSSWGIEENLIKLETRIGDISFDINTAIPLALIVNELLTNSLKHAFPEGISGSIVLELTRQDANQFRLMIADDGVGFPVNIDFRTASSLGLRLLNMLSEQIGAEVNLKRDEGTVFTLTFSVEDGGDG